MGNITGVPVTYALQRTLANESGFITGCKEVLAFRQLKCMNRNGKKRLDLYNPFYSDDFVEMGILIPEQERELEYQRPITKHDSEVRDSVFFCGFNSKNESLIVSVSLNGEGLASAWFHMSLSNGKTYSLPLDKLCRVPRTGKETFAAGGLRLKCLLPMRKWRISFNGILLEQDNTANTKKDVHIKFSFVWTANSFIFDVKSDIPTYVMAKYLSSQNWNAYFPDIQKYLESLDSYVQAGSMSGTIKIEESDENVKHFWGTRKRSYDGVRCSTVGATVEYFSYTSEGEMLYFADRKMSPENSSTLQYGCVVMANSGGGPVETMKIASNDDLRTSINFSFGKFTWKADFEKADFITTVKDFHLPKVLHTCPVNLGGPKGRGLIISSEGVTECETVPGQQNKYFLPLLEELPGSNEPLVLSLKESACRHPSVSGGKGSSLADLHLLSELDKTFSVPKGVVITTTAYEMFIKHCNFGVELIRLQTAAGKLQTEDFRKECERVSKLLVENALPAQITTDLRAKLMETLGGEIENMKVAVRSSATGEDSEEMSAAGQMKTFLGVQGLKQICEAVVKCWSSQFEYIACQYKRQNGQLLNSPMSVVVQEIVNAEVAGVMFTCDPVTGDPRRITITSNYGLGESVVSAVAEPDTITLRRGVEGEIELESITVGRKSVMTVLKDGGSVEEAVPEDHSSTCSLPENMAIKLAEIGVKVEESYGCRMDVEWAVKEGILYLLQARPVTTFDKESNFEIMHENDLCYRTENEWLTVANAGEVFPGATSNLGLSSGNKFLFEIVMLRLWGEQALDMFPYCPYYQHGLGPFANHLVLNLLDLMLQQYQGSYDAFSRSQLISTFGRTIEDEDILQKAVYRNKFTTKTSSILRLFRIVKSFWTLGKNLKKHSDAIRGLRVDLSRETSLEDMFLSIIRQWIACTTPIGIHYQCTTYSSITNVILCSVLVSGNNGEWNQNVFNDVAYVLSSCNEVESAQIPLDMERLAKAIEKDYGSGFNLLDSQEALTWLERTNKPSGAQFEKFLKTNGHRCVKEFDLYSKPWGSDPLPLIKIIQDLVVKMDRTSVTKVPLTTEETMKNLKIPLSGFKRFLMKIIIPYCRTAVGYRETSKSMMVGVVDSLRGAYRQMAERMVLEGYLPNPDVFFFLQHYEVMQLLKTRSPILVQKAIRRKNLFPEMEKMLLPELSEGFPVPINYETEEYVTEGSVCVKGVPVSQGVAVGNARVATSLEEAAEIQQGEILIAYSTDIGWSPYFPLLSGVVTELGGLISHGAVVAREYGLPCVVSAHGATKRFRTGDKIQVDGSKGTITRID